MAGSRLPHAFFCCTLSNYLNYRKRDEQRYPHLFQYVQLVSLPYPILLLLHTIFDSRSDVGSSSFTGFDPRPVFQKKNS
ncbi:hypothetical protein L873DRAFT_1799243 [Choiromyces venosus 120613-1]|uniref:Uncharacterized protein n=1 Tax=Choiromyces venosus 120613-1 TaxID=1336337 RepID=A0A3N4KES1_9PEZI|nr:hypothetical protein L873DRAFT_1799243 [Choiromyces venosus 120613-1]